jgi:hypothetical protein
VDGNYSVKEGYCFLSDNFLPAVDLIDLDCRVLKKLWDSLAPMKVMVFSWQLMLQGLPMRVNFKVSFSNENGSHL